MNSDLLCCCLCISTTLCLCDLVKHTSEVCDRRLDASKKFSKKFFSGRNLGQSLDSSLIVVVSFNYTCDQFKSRELFCIFSKDSCRCCSICIGNSQSVCSFQMWAKAFSCCSCKSTVHHSVFVNFVMNTSFS